MERPETNSLERGPLNQSVDSVASRLGESGRTFLDDELVRRLGQRFREHGWLLYLVGGPVRDAVLGRPTHDLDFATDASPAETRAILDQLRPTATYSIGEKFGTIGATFGDVAVE